MNITKLVSTIDYALATDISLIRVTASEVRLTSDVNWTQVHIKPFPNLSISDKIEDKNNIWTAELTFFTCQSIPRYSRLVWRLGLTNGRYILIGDGKRPYPVCSISETMPESPADNQLMEIKVTYSTARIIPHIV